MRGCFPDHSEIIVSYMFHVRHFRLKGSPSLQHTPMLRDTLPEYPLLQDTGYSTPPLARLIRAYY